MLTLIGLFYLLYSVRLLFINEPMKEYSAIIAITIALLSFVELWLSIYHLFKERKSRNLTAIAFRTMGLALSLFALVNTQSSIFMALGKDYRTVKRILWHDIWRDSNRSGSLPSHHDLRTFKEGRDKALGMIQCVMS